MKQSIFYMAMLLMLTGCEKSGIVDEVLPYEENLVVQSELKSGKTFSGVTFTRTLPPGEEYSIEGAEVKDVVAYLKVNGVQVIPLHYTSKGLYKPLYEIAIISGNKYELFGKRGEFTFYSSTTVPYPPVFSSVQYNSGTNSFHLYVVPKEKEVYGVIWVIGDFIDMASSYPGLSTPGSTSDNVGISTSVLPEKYRSSVYDGMRYIKVCSYDTPFFNFYKSIKNNEPVQDVFIQGTGSILWNVSGKNSMGLFIGTAEGNLYFVN